MSRIAPIRSPQFSGVKESLTALSKSMLFKQMAVLALPAGFITYQHIQWMQTPQSKKAMAVHMGTFWAGMYGAIYVLHKLMRKAKTPTQKLMSYMLPGVITVAGFYAGRELAMRLFPQTPQPLNKPSLSSTPLMPKAFQTFQQMA